VGILSAGLTITGAYVLLRGFYQGPRNENKNPNNPTPNPPRKRKYVETRTDEYGRQYKIEREETIE